MIQAPYLACAVQLTSTPDLEANLAQAAGLIARAAARGARLIGLPENFPQICETQEAAAAAVPATYPLAEAFLADQARRHGVVVFGGVVAPLLWTGAVYSFMGVLNAALHDAVYWPAFVASQFVYGLTAGLVVVRSEQGYVGREVEVP